MVILLTVVSDERLKVLLQKKQNRTTKLENILEVVCRADDLQLEEKSLQLSSALCSQTPF